MRVSVFGLGYVGAVSCGCFAHDGMEVVGVDVNPDKVDLINSGRAPILEERIGEMIAETVAARRLRATTDVEQAVLDTDISVVSVGTPSGPTGSLDLSAVERVSEQIGRALKRKAGRHLIVVRSTVLPGTVRGLVIPAVERESGKSFGEGFGVCFNPEFLREGSSVHDHYHPPYTLIGCTDQADGKLAASLYRMVEADVHYVAVETAEMVKYVCNAFHALKISFANEMGILAQSMGVDSHEVMDIVCRDTKLNISARYLSPGFAFGGSCLPKDVRALLSQAREKGLDTPLTRSILETNRWQVDRAINLIHGMRKRKVTMLGITFKAGTDDLRESPLVSVTESLIGKGHQVRIFDSNISLSRLVGANKKYIEGEIPHLARLLTEDFDAAVSHGDVLVIGNRAPEFARLKERKLREDQVVVDLARIPGLGRNQGFDYRGITW